MVVFSDVPAETSRRRWQANRRTGVRYDVRDDDFLYVVEHFEPPQDDERTLRYDGTEPMGEWVRRELMLQSWKSPTEGADESMGCG